MIRTSYSILLFFILGLLGCENDHSNAETSVIFEQLDTAFTDICQTLNVPGAVLGVRRDNSTHFSSCGYANLQEHIPMEVDHHFRVGSITKTFTSAAVLKLAEDGFLNLDQTIDSILPDMLPNGDKLTIRLLLQMRSGLSDYTQNEAFSNRLNENPLAKWDVEQLASLVHIVKQPDSLFEYRNINYIVLGKIIEVSSGQSFADYIADNFLQPLQLAQTSMPVDEKMVPHSAIGYLPIDDKTTPMGEIFDPSWAGAAGYMISTAADLLVWLKALPSGELISLESYSQMKNFKPATLRGIDGGYGLGWIDFNGAHGHGGNYSDIYTGALFTYKGYDIVVLANGQKVDTTGDATDIFFELIKVL